MELAAKTALDSNGVSVVGTGARQRDRQRKRRVLGSSNGDSHWEERATGFNRTTVPRAISEVFP